MCHASRLTPPKRVHYAETQIACVAHNSICQQARPWRLTRGRRAVAVGDGYKHRGFDRAPVDTRRGQATECLKRQLTTGFVKSNSLMRAHRNSCPPVHRFSLQRPYQFDRREVGVSPRTYPRGPIRAQTDDTYSRNIRRTRCGTLPRVLRCHAFAPSAGQTSRFRSTTFVRHFIRTLCAGLQEDRVRAAGVGPLDCAFCVFVQVAAAKLIGHRACANCELLPNLRKGSVNRSLRRCYAARRSSQAQGVRRAAPNLMLRKCSGASRLRSLCSPLARP